MFPLIDDELKAIRSARARKIFQLGQQLLTLVDSQEADDTSYSRGPKGLSVCDKSVDSLLLELDSAVSLLKASYECT